MTFDEYWTQLQKSTPQLRTSSRLTLSVDVFKKAMRRAFLKGLSERRSETEDRQKASRDFNGVGDKTGLNSILDAFMGKL